MTDAACGKLCECRLFGRRWTWSLAACLAVAMWQAWPSTSKAAITIFSGDNIVRANRNGGPPSDERSAPFNTSASLTATAADSAATTNYNFVTAGDTATFEWQFSHTRDGMGGSLAQSLGLGITFRVDTDTTYDISGSYQLDGRKAIVQHVMLYDTANIFGPYELNSYNVSLNTPNESLSVGEATGDESSVTGLTSGTLLGGHTYALFYVYYIKTDLNSDGFSDSGGSASGDLRLTLGGGVAGSSQSSPILPDAQLPSGEYVFTDVPSGRWFDPPSTFGYTYEMTTPGSLFTSISGFPTGFVDDFTVMAGSTNLGAYGPGDTLTFPGSGVSSFSITGINPLVDGSDPAAFPLQLTFNTPTASFTMLPLDATAAATPEPTSMATLLVMGLVMAGRVAKRRRKS